MIKIQNLNKTYDRRRSTANHVLHDVSFKLPDTGFVCILGPSGCGKTSLLNAVGGLDRFDGGTITTDNVSASKYGTRRMEAERNRSFGYIFQNYYLLTDHSVGYNVYIGLHSLALSHAEKLRRVDEALTAVDMLRYKKRTVSELSGGQQQRVAIARALAKRPRVIFADEPTGNLDEANTVNICTILRKISRTSLVVMVTHEERIARFYADRIITLADGRIKNDESEWQRDPFVSSEGIYSGDYIDKSMTDTGINLRMLREEDAEPVNLTVLSAHDRIIIKLDDTRTVSYGGNDEQPRITEGKRPVLRIEEIDRDDDFTISKLPDNKKSARAGRGITHRMMRSEAKRLLFKRDTQSFGMWMFLFLLTLLTVIIVSDYVTVSSVPVTDFITTDSHILSFDLSRDRDMEMSAVTLDPYIDVVMDYLDSSGTGIRYVPRVSSTAKMSSTGFSQMSAVTSSLGKFSYVPLSALNQDTLICGRMPERPDEVVVDRWVLENFISGDGIVEGSAKDVKYFLGSDIIMTKLDYSPKIVGISDSGEPSVYIADSALATIGVTGSYVVTLSELRAMYPAKFDGLDIASGECVMNTSSAGAQFANAVGTYYTTNSGQSFLIKSTVAVPDAYFYLVIGDEDLDMLLRSVITTEFSVYCENKAEMLDYLSCGLDDRLDGKVKLNVIDEYSDMMRSYTEASTLRTDARMIVTVTVIAMCAVMLYLAQRSRVQKRIEMIAVYRLLGIPGSKLTKIFIIEACLLSLVSSLPAAVLTYAVFAVLQRLPSLDFQMILPWYALVITYAWVLLFHIIVSVLPVRRLLRLPPSVLASKYDL